MDLYEDRNVDSNVDLNVDSNVESPLSFRIQTIVKPENLENKTDILGDDNDDENSNTVNTEKTVLNLKVESLRIATRSPSV